MLASSSWGLLLVEPETAAALADCFSLVPRTRPPPAFLHLWLLLWCSICGWGSSGRRGREPSRLNSRVDSAFLLSPVSQAGHHLAAPPRKQPASETIPAPPSQLPMGPRPLLNSSRHTDTRPHLSPFLPLPPTSSYSPPSSWRPIKTQVKMASTTPYPLCPSLTQSEGTTPLL